MAAKDKKYYWLRLKRDFFKRHDIQIIEDMPNGKDYILFYLKLLCESVDHEGNLRFNDEIPYNEQMLATITRTNIDTVRSAIKVFSQLKMIEIMDDGTYYMSEVQKMMGSETYWAERKRIQKAKQKEEKIIEIQEPKYPYVINKSNVMSQERIITSNGIEHYIDEKRYGGNGKIIMAKYDGKCTECGNDDKVVIHHKNGYSNNIEDLVVLCTKCHGLAHSNGVGKVPTSPGKSKSKSKILDIDIDTKKEIIVKERKLNSPTIEEITEYCKQRNNSIDPETFYDYYESKGWMIGKTEMKDWKAAIRTWERNEKETVKSNDPFDGLL